MVAPPLVALGLFVFEQLVFVTGTAFMLRIYSRYGFESHGYMALSFFLWMLSSGSRLATNMLEPSDIATAETLWAFMNLFLLLGILTTFYSFFYFQYNRLPARANVASTLGGATILAYSNPDWYAVAYDSNAGMFTASYSPIVSVLAVPLILFFIGVFLLPIVTKMRLAKSRETRLESGSLLVVLSFLLVWAALSLASGVEIIRTIRPFFFAGGWMVWIALTARRPLILIFTQRRFQKILVMTDAGYPVILYNFETGTLEDPALFSALFSALQTAMTDLLKTDTELRSIYYENRVVSIAKRGTVRFLGIGDEPDTALEAALRDFADRLISIYPALLTDDGTAVVGVIDNAAVEKLIHDSFDEVMF